MTGQIVGFDRFEAARERKGRPPRRGDKEPGARRLAAFRGVLGQTTTKVQILGSLYKAAERHMAADTEGILDAFCRDTFGEGYAFCMTGAAMLVDGLEGED